jgi:hypothetical protein
VNEQQTICREIVTGIFNVASIIYIYIDAISIFFTDISKETRCDTRLINIWTGKAMPADSARPQTAWLPPGYKIQLRFCVGLWLVAANGNPRRAYSGGSSRPIAADSTVSTLPVPWDAAHFHRIGASQNQIDVKYISWCCVSYWYITYWLWWGKASKVSALVVSRNRFTFSQAQLG